MLFVKRLNEKKGQALVEFALILPILLLIVSGIFEFGRYFNAYILVDNTSREIARQVAVGTNTVKNGDEIDVDGLSDKVLINIAYNPKKEYGGTAIVTAICNMDAITPIVGPMVFKDGITVTSTTHMRIEQE